MRKKRLLTLTAVFFLAALVLPAASAFAARQPGITILVDLTHNQPATGIDIMMKMLPEAHWYLLVPSEEVKSSLPKATLALADEVIVGSLVDVKDRIGMFDVIIIGQPCKEFSPDEIQVIKDWFYSGADQRKVLWVAGDSDYPAQGGNLEIAQHAIDEILEAVGSCLREDFVSVEDYSSNAGKPYRVVGLVEPDPGAEIVGFAAHKVLFHGPGVVAYVDENGNWKSLTDSKPANVYRIVWTTNNSAIVEHQPKAPGAPGETGRAYSAGQTGKFVLLAAEVMNVSIEGKNTTRVVIVSGESPYGDYQPGVTYMYHGVKLDGPRFFRNLLLWSTGYMGELQDVQDLMNENKKLSEKVSELEKKVAAGAGGKSIAVAGIVVAIIAIIMAALALAKKK